MSSAPRAWVLNLDAEDELCAPEVSRDPFAAIEARPHLASALAALVGSDVVLRRGLRAPLGALGRAFSPTPRALAALTCAGATAPPAPPISVLRRVADRRFGLALGDGHTPGAIVLVAAGVLEALGPALRGPRVFKRIFGFAGRGRLLSRGGPPSDRERAFVARALDADGAVVVEPWLDRVADFGLHGFVDRRGDLTLGTPTVQQTTSGGGWRASRAAAPDEVGPQEAAALADQARLAGAALADAGYFGPFGIDAFRWTGAAAGGLGGAGLVSRCEVNARYTMGWATGMGEQRPDLDP